MEFERTRLKDKLMTLHRASLDLLEEISVDSLLERIASVACEQANARYAALAVSGKDGKFEKFIVVGMEGDVAKKISHQPQGLGLLGEIFHKKEAVRVTEISKDDRSIGFPEHHPSMRSFLGVPILQAGNSVGQLYLTDKKDAKEFTTEDQQLIELLATYAAVAIKNANYVEELHKRDELMSRQTQDLALLNNIGESLTTSVEQEQVLQNTLSLVISHLNVEAGEIFLLNSDTSIFEMALHRGQAAEAFWTRNRFSMGEGIIGEVGKSGQAIISYDLEKDQRFFRSAIVRSGFKQMAAFPLTSRGVVIGVLAVFSLGTTQIDDRDLRIINSICNWAGIALENTRIHTDARRIAILEERDRIAMDLHDGIIQEIYGVGMMLEQAKHDIPAEPTRSENQIQTAINGLNRTIRDLRSYILDLKPRELGEENLLDGLKRLVMEYKVNTLSDAVLSGQERDLVGLPQKQALALFLICQEALANIAKHAHAKRVQVTVWVSTERVMMEIMDNGVGFEVDNMSQSIGHGLSNMHTRARNVGGDVEITSSPREGSSVFTWVPRGNPE